MCRRAKSTGVKPRASSVCRRTMGRARSRSCSPCSRAAGGAPSRCPNCPARSRRGGSRVTLPMRDTSAARARAPPGRSSPKSGARARAQSDEGHVSEPRNARARMHVQWYRWPHGSVAQSMSGKISAAHSAHGAGAHAAAMRVRSLYPRARGDIGRRARRRAGRRAGRLARNEPEPHANQVGVPSFAVRPPPEVGRAWV